MNKDFARILITALAVVSVIYSGSIRADTVIKLGQLNPRAPFTYIEDDSRAGKLYNGVWGYSSGTEEYALLCHSDGLSIINTTDPIHPFEVQFMSLAGGRVHRDVHVFKDTNTGKSYAYVGGQEGSDLWVIDLSYLPNPIPSSGIKNLGYPNYAHTLFMLPDRSPGDPADGLLFLNSANQLGCTVLDVATDPWNPKRLSWKWIGGVAHDVFARDGVLYSSDGGNYNWSLHDLAAARTRPYDATLDFLGQTSPVWGIFAHSCWLSDDSGYLYAFEEMNAGDIMVYNVSDPVNPVYVKNVQWSRNTPGNPIVHNGQVLGNRLHVAYYEAGYRVFDITDPENPVESGYYETWRDPNDDGIFDASILPSYNGAWNVYVFAPSKHIYVSDMKSGLFIFDVITGTPARPTNLTATPGLSRIYLNWIGSSGATSYTVKRSKTRTGPYVTIATGLTGTRYVDTNFTSDRTYYYVVTAVNTAGESNYSNRIVTSAKYGHIR